jgi:hypothetical protein
MDILLETSPMTDGEPHEPDLFLYWKNRHACRDLYHAVTPPSTGKATPLMNAASSEAR